MWSPTHTPWPGHKLGLHLSYLPELIAAAPQADHVYSAEGVFLHDYVLPGSAQRFGNKTPGTCRG